MELIYIAVAVILVVAVIVIIKRRKKGAEEVPQGIQIFDENGDIVVDMTSRTSKILGTINTDGKDGSLTDDRLLEGNLWAAVVKVEPTGSKIYNIVGLEIKSNGSELTWTHRNTRLSGSYNFNFIYGIY